MSDYQISSEGQMSVDSKLFSPKQSIKIPIILVYRGILISTLLSRFEFYELRNGKKRRYRFDKCANHFVYLRDVWEIWISDV